MHCCLYVDHNWFLVRFYLQFDDLNSAVVQILNNPPSGPFGFSPDSFIRYSVGPYPSKSVIHHDQLWWVVVHILFSLTSVVQIHVIYGYRCWSFMTAVHIWNEMFVFPHLRVSLPHRPNCHAMSATWRIKCVCDLVSVPFLL